MANFPELPPQTESQPTTKAAVASLTPTLGQKILRLFGWQFWTVAVMISFGVTGYVATSALLSLNTPKGCESVYWPLASGARRLYCAQVKAQTGDARSLLAAIALVSELPDDHPLRREINKNIKLWSEEVLIQGEEQFQKGDLKAAMAIAENIPSEIAAKEVVEEKVKQWRKIWEQGKTIEQAVEERLNQAAWNLAFNEAGKLTDLKNEYLANRRYTEVVAKIQQAKIEGAVLDEARDAFDEGGVENLIAAMEKAQAIEANSYSYQAAQKLVAQVRETLVKKAEEQLDQQNWQVVLDISGSISNNMDFSEKVADLREIAFAGLNAQTGTINGLEKAIAQLETISEKRPLYEKAQTLTNRWEKEIEGIEIIIIAKEYAQGGNISDLKAGMKQAKEVSADNPRYQEAQQLIAQWNSRVQIIEDRPILDRAIKISRNNSIGAYESAIAVAQEISRNRVLYSQAQGKIATWRDQIERIEDQPLLTQASRLANQGRLKSAISVAQEISQGRVLYSSAQNNIASWRNEIQLIEDRPILSRANQLASQGRLEEAIATAEQISRNRALYREAQGDIQTWRRDLAARESIRQAYQLAAAETPESLSQAIQRISQARNSDNYRYQAERLMNQWSKQIYAIALRQANEDDLTFAIMIARQIPSQSGIYQEVREKIEQWQQQLILTGED